jgi:metal-responsive CopG/Arc/MetJ family transcriptional regulator
VKKVKKSRAGRPATGTDPLIAARLPRELILRLDRYAKEQGVSRSKALRELITEALDKRKP